MEGLLTRFVSAICSCNTRQRVPVTVKWRGIRPADHAMIPNSLMTAASRNHDCTTSSLTSGYAGYMRGNERIH